MFRVNSGAAKIARGRHRHRGHQDAGTSGAASSIGVEAGRRCPRPRRARRRGRRHVGAERAGELGERLGPKPVPHSGRAPAARSPHRSFPRPGRRPSGCLFDLDVDAQRRAARLLQQHAPRARRGPARADAGQIVHARRSRRRRARAKRSRSQRSMRLNTSAAGGSRRRAARHVQEQVELGRRGEVAAPLYAARDGRRCRCAVVPSCQARGPRAAARCGRCIACRLWCADALAGRAICPSTCRGGRGASREFSCRHRKPMASPDASSSRSVTAAASASAGPAAVACRLQIARESAPAIL